MHGHHPSQPRRRLRARDAADAVRGIQSSPGRDDRAAATYVACARDGCAPYTSSRPFRPEPFEPAPVDWLEREPVLKARLARGVQLSGRADGSEPLPLGTMALEAQDGASPSSRRATFVRQTGCAQPPRCRCLQFPTRKRQPLRRGRVEQVGRVGRKGAVRVRPFASVLRKLPYLPYLPHPPYLPIQPLHGTSLEPRRDRAGHTGSVPCRTAGQEVRMGARDRL
jgi:hypothetical protein